ARLQKETLRTLRLCVDRRDVLLLFSSGSRRRIEPRSLAGIFVDGGSVAGIPVFEGAGPAGVVEIRPRFEQGVDVLPVGDFHYFLRRVAKRFDLRVPEDRILVELGLDLNRRQLWRIRSRAVVDVARGREWPRHLEQIDRLGQRDGTDLHLL